MVTDDAYLLSGKKLSMFSPAWLEAISTTCLVILTGYCVILAHLLLKAQVEPVVTMSLEPETSELVMENHAAFGVHDLSVECHIRALPGPVESQGKKVNLLSLPKFQSRKSQRIAVSEIANSAVKMRREAEQSFKCNEHTEARVLFQLTWRRDFDGRVFKAKQLFEVAENAKAGRADWLSLDAPRDPVLDDARPANL